MLSFYQYIQHQQEMMTYREYHAAGTNFGLASIQFGKMVLTWYWQYLNLNAQLHRRHTLNLAAKIYQITKIKTSPKFSTIIIIMVVRINF